MNSILTSIKKLLGVDEEYTHFDTDIIMHINSVMMVLTQIGVGPANGFLIADKSSTWVDFLGTRTDLESVKTFIYLKVRLIFDPPSSSYVVEAMNRQLSEFEWRLSTVDTPVTVITEGDGPNEDDISW